MALTIKELEIRIRVGDDEQPAAPSEAPSGEGEGRPRLDHARLVDESVRRVLLALKSLEER